MSKPTVKERNLLKGAIRRVFARSELHQQVLNAAVVFHLDPKRPRVKMWVKCAKCGGLDAKSYAAVDHIEPVVNITSSFEEMTFDELVSRIWCSIDNLQVLCYACHEAKSKAENKLRREARKSKIHK